ncbi:MAG: hypothetical protein KDB07_01185, partial [Planctomycetes bacterium]|nr:hypothetical protein [Planctomycetota bacterium]
ALKFLEEWRDIHGGLGRIMVCQLALATHKKTTKASVRKSLKTWLELRHELDIVRDYPITHYHKRFNNAAYYWLFGHYFALRAANFNGKGKVEDEARETILAVLMQDKEKDGTWLGHHSFGPLCGTAQALMIFGEFDAPWRLPHGAGPKEKPITPSESRE